LIPPDEHDAVRQALERAGEIARDYLDVPGLLAVAQGAAPWKIDAFPKPAASRRHSAEPLKIGIFRDAAFQFYYQENIEALTDRGARVTFINALEEKTLPPVDALYIGGGFPETRACRLAQNESFRKSVKEAAEKGLPIYAECGGFIYLGESLRVGENRYPMAGVLPVEFILENKPQGHGYTTLVADQDNPFFPAGTTLTGHEFHYCRILSRKEQDTYTAFKVLKGQGLNGHREGLCRKHVLAGFTHLHALGTDQWANAIIREARRHRNDHSIIEDNINIIRRF